MNASILNREFRHPTDGWYHIEPMGEHPNREFGVVQVVDADAVRGIVNRFNTEADDWKLAHGEEFPGMLIDHEHFSHDSDKETRGYGWLMRLQNRANDPHKPGIYGQVNWTATGRASVDGGDYRFFSTEYDPNDLAVLNRIDNRKRVRPLRLGGLTLTNRPNNKGAKPITNKENLPNNSANRTAADPADSPKSKNIHMKIIATEVGLSADASEESIVAEVRKLKNRSETAEKDLKTSKEDVTKLTNRVTELADAQADADLDAHGIKEDDADRPTLKKALIENRETGLAFLKKIAKTEPKEIKKPLTNRANSQTPNKSGAPDGEADKAKEQKRAVLIKNRSDSKMRENKTLSLTSAYHQAGLEVDQEIAAGVTSKEN